MSDQNAAIARALLAKDPEWEYGEILPIATTKGKIRPAIPDILRTPMQSWVDIMDEMGTGKIQTHEGTEEMMPDILNVTPFPGAVTARGANAIRRGALSEETRWAPYPVSYGKAAIAEALAPMTERLEQRRERRALARSPVARDVPPAPPPSSAPAQRAAPPPAPPTAPPDVDGLLSEIDELSKQIGSNGDEISQLRYSQNRGRLRQNPNSLQSRLQNGPRPYSGKRPPDRDEMVQMQMAHGEFRAAIEAPAQAFREGQMTKAQFDAITDVIIRKAARGNGIDPRYLIKQIAKDQKRDPKGWALTFPDKK